jgi:protein ImuB
MQRRVAAIWFRHLKTDWMIRHHPHLKEIPFVLQLPDHGRMRITEPCAKAKAAGVQAGMAVADAKVIIPHLQVLDDTPELAQKLLTKLCHWCIRFTPVAAIDIPDGLLLDVSGCAHLWGGEEAYLKSIVTKLNDLGYHVRAAMADIAGTAWAISRYGRIKAIIKSGEQANALLSLPPAALRLPLATLERLHKLGLHRIGSFMNMPPSVLRRRFGEHLLTQLDYALGHQDEMINPIQLTAPYLERLPCIEPISTRKGIEIALERLLATFCKRLQGEGKGLRAAIFKGYRVDNEIVQTQISTNHPSHNPVHLFRLFELRIACIEPALGIELFTLEAHQVENVTALQETFWAVNSSFESKEIAELLDGLQSKFGNDTVHRYLPDEHHLPERSIKLSNSLGEQPAKPWCMDKWRPIQLLKEPQPIEVTAPIPDYPPMNFRYNGKLHYIKKADACERIEPEWWLDGGLHRDYYIVEDEAGKRYWVFRLGHYNADAAASWFIHGFFA